MREIIFNSLDGEAPYSLGNANYSLTSLECPKCKHQSDADNLRYANGYYDGYSWTHPMCEKCFEFLSSEKVHYETTETDYRITAQTEVTA